MRNLETWLSLYGESHQHPTNIWIHKLCVPAIFITVLGLLWALPMPQSIRGLVTVGGVAWVNWATLAALAALLFYVRLSVRMALGVTALIALGLAWIVSLERAGASVLAWSIGVFVVAWIGQFIGHHIEGKKPSFFQDLQFLLIGPAWTLAALYRGLGIRY